MLGSSWAKTTAKRLLRAKAAASQGLKTKFFDYWHPELDEALQCLPETDIFPHELFRLLMKMSNPMKKQLILVTDHNEPVALAGLRNRWGYWEPVTQWIVPGVLFPVKEGYLARVLPALGVEMQIAWWRWETPPPHNRWILNARSEPIYAARCTEDYEKHWRKSSLLRNVRSIRNRCAGFDIKVNLPGSTEWTIRNWDAKWCPQGIAHVPDLDERLLTVQYLEKKGLYYTLSLLDQDKIVAGLTFIIHRNDAVSHHTYRNQEYNRHGVMTRLWDYSFPWAKEMGFDYVELGGSFDYKREWAPQHGEKWKFDVCPGNVLLEKRASRILLSVRNMLKYNK